MCAYTHPLVSTQHHTTPHFMCASHRFSLSEVRYAPTFLQRTFGPVPATQFSDFSKFLTRDPMPHHVHIFTQNFKSFTCHHCPPPIFGPPTRSDILSNIPSDQSQQPNFQCFPNLRPGVLCPTISTSPCKILSQIIHHHHH